MATKWKSDFSRFASDYGMFLVLLLLSLYFSVVTFKEQQVKGAAAAEDVARQILEQYDTPDTSTRVMIVARWNEEDVEFADALSEKLGEKNLTIVQTIKGEPLKARRALQSLVDSGSGLDVIACNRTTAAWILFDDLGEKFPTLRNTNVVQPRSYYWPDFLKGQNLLNVANQIVVIAILAIGMTMVIITGGIDLSVGSLIALSAVMGTLLIRELAGGVEATALGMTLCCLLSIVVCGLMGLFSGAMVTFFQIPPFIVTLAMMRVASGLSYIAASGQSVYQVPESFVWLGRGSDLLGIPNAVLLMAVLYVVAHIVMTHMTLGRYIYAVGGNREAARLSGVPVKRVLLLVYTVGGLLAGLGGIVMASQLRSGSPTYGETYELFVIAAVVVGGTSLAGGEGKIFGTLIGAFIIAVINNGMNLTGVESYTQDVVLGLVILGAVLLDMIKKGGWAVLRRQMGLSS